MINKIIRPYNDKGQRHGYWEYYFGRNLRYKCFFHNDKEVGYEEYYYWGHNTVGVKTYNI